MCVDNAAAVSITQGTAGPVPWRTRHLRVKSAALTEAMADKEIVIRYCPGVAQVADIGTKTLDSVKITAHETHIDVFYVGSSRRPSDQ